MPGTRTRFGVGVVVRSDDGLVLVGRRYAEPGAPLALPGGKPEAGETIEQCAVGELALVGALRVDPAEPAHLLLFAATRALLERLPA